MASHNTPIDQILIVGGGSKNEIWMQICADVLGKQIDIPAVTIGACFGDALIAASAVKHPGFESFEDMIKDIKPGKSYYPDMAKHEIYIKYQAIYDALYPTTANLMHEVDKIVNCN